MSDSNTRLTRSLKKEKKKKIIKWISIISVLVIILLTLLSLGNKSSKEPTVAKTTESTSTTTQQVSSSDTSTSVVKETNLSEEDLKKWVMAILDLTPPPPTRYILTVKIDETDNLAYINAEVDQLDGAGTFRVNAKGQLEYMPYMGQFTGVDEWILMSDKYMDTTIAEEYYKEQAKKQDKENDDLNKIKSHLIGNKYVVKPILYDGMDSEQAMDENKAPQSLIHDGVQIVSFKDDTNVHIELAGIYRPDYDETYSLSSETINFKDYYIPYKYNGENLSFDTWTTDINGHTITWAITPQ